VWATTPHIEKLQKYIEHIELFIETYQPTADTEKWLRNWESLKRMAKIYVHGIEGASAFRDVFMRSTSPDEMITHLRNEITKLTD
jgi:tRNA-dihydrouridine synthase